MNARPRKTPTTRRGFIAAIIAAITLTGSKTSPETLAVRRQGYRVGKHNGQNAGTFGRIAAKAHRIPYVSATMQGGR